MKVSLTELLEEVGQEMIHGKHPPASRRALLAKVRQRLERAAAPESDSDASLYWEDDVVSGIYVTESGRLVRVTVYEDEGRVQVQITDLATGRILDDLDDDERPLHAVVTAEEALAFVHGMVMALWAG